MLSMDLIAATWRRFQVSKATIMPLAGPTSQP